MEICTLIKMLIAFQVSYYNECEGKIQNESKEYN
jgi:hypothetical protein